MKDNGLLILHSQDMTADDLATLGAWASPVMILVNHPRLLRPQYQKGADVIEQGTTVAETFPEILQDM